MIHSLNHVVQAMNHWRSIIEVLLLAGLLSACGVSPEFVDNSCCGKFSHRLNFPQHETTSMKEPTKVASYEWISELYTLTSFAMTGTIA
jgi:hypothetical protein